MHNSLAKAITTLLLPSLLSTTLALPSTPSSNEATAAEANTTAPLLLNSREILADTPSGLSVEAWSKPECHGAVVLIDDVSYGVQNALSEGMRSYRINRDLTEGEQLDFSRYKGYWRQARQPHEETEEDGAGETEAEIEVEGEEAEGEEQGGPANPLAKRHRGAFPPPKPCGLFVENALPFTKAGCWTLSKRVDCYRIWHH